jgi:imidazole glycerol-phosphate synthase subunit HisF
MLKKRIIACLDIQDGRTVKGINFVGIRDAGDPVELGKQYAEQGIDELVFLDITATVEKRKALAKLVEKIAKQINIPFTVGGGISALEDARVLINAGADKISINSAAARNPELISEIAAEFGNQCVVTAIDAKFADNELKVYLNGGRIPTELNALEWAKTAEEKGAGEILLTSMNHDGTKNGFALEITDTFSRALNIPVIASGGAGRSEHFSDLFKQTKASAGLAASIFHYGEIKIPELKSYLKKQNIAVR